jgi:serine phosphatase RsbU (regulator of sigma subunit)
MARKPRRAPRGRRQAEPEIIEEFEELEPIPASRGRGGGRRGGPAPRGATGMTIGAKIFTITIPPFAIIAILALLLLMPKPPQAAKKAEVDNSIDAGGIAAVRMIAAVNPDAWDAKGFTTSAFRETMIKNKKKELEVLFPLADDSRHQQKQDEELEIFKNESLDKLLPPDENEATKVQQLGGRLDGVAQLPGFGAETGFLNATINVLKFSRTGKSFNKRLNQSSFHGGEKRRVGQTKVGHGTVDGVPARLYEHPILDWKRQPNGSARVIIAVPEPKQEKAQAQTGRMKLIMIVFLIFAAAVIVSLILATGISAPLKSIVRDIDAVARGDVGRRFQSSSAGGEIGLIGRHIEKMTVSLDAQKDFEVEQQTAEAEFSIATQIQENLLPETPPRIEGYEIEALHKPSPDLGSDYHDFIEIDETHLGVILADASVKGTTGAMIMSQVRSLIRAYAPESSTASEALRQVNRVFARDLRRGLYVTAVYMILNLETGVISVANAGHLPTIFWKLGKRAIARLPGEGLALGLDAGPVFDQKLEDKRVQLEAGDRVVLFTDGAVEAENADGEIFGEPNLHELIKKEAPKNSAAFVNFVANEIDLFHEGAIQKDNITLLTIRKVR